MASQSFEWDEAKNKSNLKKHGVTVEQASRVFDDPWCISTLERVTANEERWQTVGLVRGVYLLLVVHTIAEEHQDHSWMEIIRIISARRAEPQERMDYEKQAREV